MWSRRGVNGNGVVPLEFPAFTCGLPSNSVVTQGAAVRFSPLAAGLGAPAGALPAAVPLTVLRQPAETSSTRTVTDFPTAGRRAGAASTSTVTAPSTSSSASRSTRTATASRSTTECANPTRKDLFVEIDYMQDHKPDPKALSQTQSPATLVNDVPVGVKSVREAFAAAPVAPPSPSTCPGIRLHLQRRRAGDVHTPLRSATPATSTTSRSPPAPSGQRRADPTQAVGLRHHQGGELRNGHRARQPPNRSAERETAGLPLRSLRPQRGRQPGGGSNSSGCGEIGGDDAVVTLGSFAQTTVNNVSHRRGTTDQQAGTFMHEFGHLLGFGHGGLDAVNCKPNYRSVMSYTRQFAGSPIPNRRLDYSRSEDPSCRREGFWMSGALNEISRARDPPESRSDTPWSSPRRTRSSSARMHGPLAQSPQPPAPINWNRNLSGKTHSRPAPLRTSMRDPPCGCDGAGTLLEGHDDWGNILYRASAAINFAGGETSPRR